MTFNETGGVTAVLMRGGGEGWGSTSRQACDYAAAAILESNSAALQG